MHDPTSTNEDGGGEVTGGQLVRQVDDEPVEEVGYDVIMIYGRRHRKDIDLDLKPFRGNNNINNIYFIRKKIYNLKLLINIYYYLMRRRRNSRGDLLIDFGMYPLNVCVFSRGAGTMVCM